MDWMIPVNEILKDDITKLNYKLIPPNFKGDIRTIRAMQHSLSRLIDVLGEQSAAAQGLNRTITSAEKLRNTPTYTLYLLKDSRANGGKGEAIAMLKIGRKHLFLFNENDKVCEVEPLCVLDFFVVKDRQRSGYGKFLFDHMLHDMHVTVEELAIDGPSRKMEQFIRKNYGVEFLTQQNNNFAISPGFFKFVPEIRKSGQNTPDEPANVGRFAAPKPQSAIASVIHGVGSYCDVSGVQWDKTGDTQQKAVASSPRIEQPSGPPEPKQKPDPEPEVVDEAVVNNTKTRPSTLSVEPVSETGAAIPAVSLAGSSISRRDSQLTDQGYFDVKFYHNKLW